MRYAPFVAAVAIAFIGACGGNKDNTNQPPSTTTDTSAGSMSQPNNTTPAPAATPAPGTDTSHAMAPATPAPDTSMKKMSGKKHHKASMDTTTH